MWYIADFKWVRGTEMPHIELTPEYNAQIKIRLDEIGILLANPDITYEEQKAIGLETQEILRYYTFQSLNQDLKRLEKKSHIFTHEDQKTLNEWKVEFYQVKRLYNKYYKELEPLEERFDNLQKQVITNKIIRNPENYLSTPWDPWQGFLDTLYLAGCYTFDFLAFIIKSIEALLKNNDSQSTELLDTESDFNTFSFCSIFSKDDDKTTVVPYTGEYQCNPKTI